LQLTSPISLQAIHHVRLTVTDVERAQAFYTGVLGFQLLRQVPNGVLLTQNGFLLGLTAPYDPTAAPPADRFSEHRAGLDHLSFSVASRADLDAAAQFFDAEGISHGTINDIGPVYVMAFRDPDNIQLELTAPKA
jgi:glyoxylase I family protein